MHIRNFRTNVLIQLWSFGLLLFDVCGHISVQKDRHNTITCCRHLSTTTNHLRNAVLYKLRILSISYITLGMQLCFVEIDRLWVYLSVVPFSCSSSTLVFNVIFFKIKWSFFWKLLENEHATTKNTRTVRRLNIPTDGQFQQNKAAYLK